MKFATLALPAVLAAQAQEDDMNELIGRRWRWRHVGPLMAQEMGIMQDLEDLEPDFERVGRHIYHEVEKRVPKYLPTFMKWMKSDAVRAKKAHEMKMLRSPKGKALMKAVMHTWDDAQKVHWAAGWNQDGYGEWIKNEDLAMMFEDVYAIKEALKALVTSKMAMEDQKLGMAAITNPEAHKLQAMFFKDVGVKSWGELGQKLERMAKKLMRKMHKCPKMRRLFRHVSRLIDMAERTQETFDMPKHKDVVAWWKKHNFQPWI